MSQLGGKKEIDRDSLLIEYQLDLVSRFLIHGFISVAKFQCLYLFCLIEIFPDSFSVVLLVRWW